MSEVQEIINIENVEQIPVKVKRSYISSKFSGLTEEEIKAHKKVLKAQNNKNYKEKHMDKIREAQTRYFAKDSTKEKMRDYKRRDAKLKRENENNKINQVLNV
jgi:Fic family protein